MQWSAILLICVSIVTVQYCSARLSERRLLDELILRRLEEIGEERRRLVTVNPGAIMPSINLGGFIGRDTFDEYNLGQWMGYKNFDAINNALSSSGATQFYDHLADTFRKFEDEDIAKKFDNIDVKNSKCTYLYDGNPMRNV